MEIERVFESFKDSLLSSGIDDKLITLSKNKLDYSIKFKGNIVFKYKPGTTEYISIKKEHNEEVFNHYSSDLCKMDASFVRIPCKFINGFDGPFSELLSEVIKKMLSRFDVNGFGCCSRYIECSNQKKCIHPNKITSLGCMYKRNLDKGLIFYGSNKNI